MKSPKQIHIISLVVLIVAGISLYTCNGLSKTEHKIIQELKAQGLSGEVISAESFFKGIAPPNFSSVAGTTYKPSYNREPEIPPQCWIETSYGTQNACKYCHTDYLTKIKHGNAFPSSEDQELYNFPTPSLNKILWQNIIYPQNIENRLSTEGIVIPNIEDVEYVRHDNWMPAFEMARGNGNDTWVNHQSSNENFILFPSLNPNHLFPYNRREPHQKWHTWIY